VLGELLAGFDLGNRAEQNRQELETFLKEPNVLFLTINAQTAEQHATIYRQLRQQGTPIPTAAMALQLEMGVFTYDAHFSKIEGLTIVQREEDLG
ncbi:MAG: type II toxin-antitoxin system VapC family toxin, partial [Bacteroidota bacterium]